MKYEITETNVCGFKFCVRKLNEAPNGNWYQVGYARFFKTMNEVKEYMS